VARPALAGGSADAIYQSLTLIERDRPGLVLVAGADHVYRMDPNQMIQAHLDRDAGVTVAAIPVPRTGASDFGVIRAAAGGHRIEAFQEKPADPPCLHGSPDEAFASMGTYVFDTAVLVEALRKDAADEGSGHSMGGDIIPRLVRDGAAHVYDFLQNKVPGAARATGLLARGRHDRLLLRGAHGPVRGPPGVQPLQQPVADPDPRARGAAGQVRARGRGPGGAGVQQRDQQRGDRLWRAGAPVGAVAGVRVDSWARVERSVILHNTRIGRRAVVRNAILDKNVVVIPGASVGVDKEHDRERGFTVSEGGITVVGKGQVVAP
jgi:ADP-glucose pyrophosphorylase